VYTQTKSLAFQNCTLDCHHQTSNKKDQPQRWSFVASSAFLFALEVKDLRSEAMALKETALMSHFI
jgi:hypothetical protein